LYWALQFIQASLTMVIGALGPLFTFFFALAHGQENFRWKGLIGALMAFGGILLGIGDQIGQVESLLPILAVVVGFAAASEGTVLYKSFPKSDPLAVNAISFTTGTVMLAVISLIARETWRLPETQEAWFAYGYLVLGGSFALFYLVLYVLNRWTASATSYAFLLFPVVTIILGSWLANEVISGRFLLGAVIVLLGVWVGTIADPENI
jgi:drug/metabolite transporter (DMT)-like permease